MKLHTYSDGGARGNPGPSGIGAIVCDENDHVLEEKAECIGDGTNNVAEYRAMLMALAMAKAHGGTELVCTADSQLLIYQLQGRYRVKHPSLQALMEKVRSAAKEFSAITWRHVPREHPMIHRADAILNKALNKSGR
jgi:ribonuclease HI